MTASSRSIVYVVLVLMAAAQAVYAQSAARGDMAAAIKVRARFVHGQSVNTLEFSPDGTLLAVGGGQRPVGNGTELGTEAKQRESHYCIRLWDIDETAICFELYGHRSAVRSMAFTARGGVLASVSDSECVVWDMKSQQKEVEVPVSQIPRAVVFDSNDCLIVGSTKTLSGGYTDQGETETLRKWCRTSLEAIRRERGSGAFFRGYTLYGNRIMEEEAAADNIHAIARSADGNLLGVAGSGPSAVVVKDNGLRFPGRIRVIEVRTGKERFSIERKAGAFECIAFSHDATLLAAGASDRAFTFTNERQGKHIYETDVLVWDAVSGANMRRLEGHDGAVRSVEFCPGADAIVASASDDGTVRLWDVSKMSTLATLDAHDSPVRSLSFSPGGQLLASGAQDGTVIVWDASSVIGRAQ